MSAARKKTTNLERAGLTSTGTTAVRGPWGVVPVRVYVDSKGTRYVDRRDIERTRVPVPYMISDGAGGFIDFSVYVDGDGERVEFDGEGGASLGAEYRAAMAALRRLGLTRRAPGAN